jgi:arylsulfatase A-like enzyme
MEHGYLYHTNIAYEELIRVPLIVLFPKSYGAGIRTQAMVRHVDVLPTIAELVGVDPPSTAMGRSLTAVIDGRDTGPVESYAQGPFNAALVYGQWKVLYNDTLNTFSLYDLAKDAGETTDLWLQDPTLHVELRERLEKYLDTAREIELLGSQELDPETIRRLKALGYL